MSMINSSEFRNNSKQDGFTLIELLVAMTIMSILGITIWIGFSSAINLVHTVPESTKLIQEYINLDSVLREYVSRIKPPFWQPELDLYMDSTSVVLPFYESVKEQNLQIEYLDDYLYIRTFNEDSNDEPEQLYKAGPFSYVSFEEVTEKPQGLIGLEFTLKPEHEKIEEFKIFTRFGGLVFENE